jgi:tetratricopeptide (TPR) repeat protein
MPGQDILTDKTRSILRCVEYSYSNLSPQAQALLETLAPFSGVVNFQWLKQYTEQLQIQTALAALPFDLWGDLMTEAMRWGLLSPHPELGGQYLVIQPVLPYFLRERLNAPGREELRQAVETAFYAHYKGICRAISGAMDSKQAQEKQTGLMLGNLELENIAEALEIGLKAYASIASFGKVLSKLLDHTHEEQRGLELGERILAGLRQYPPEYRKGEIGLEIVAALGDMANRLMKTRQYENAGKLYEEILLNLKNLDGIEEKMCASLLAGTYYQLGMVAQEQREWEQAEQYYLQAMEIFIDLNDRYYLASIYHQLGMVEQEQRQWAQAEKRYRQALELKIEINDRYSQARTYHQLGRVAQEQRQWGQAEQDYGQALEISIEFNDHYNQARTYHQLGMVAQEQRQWGQAEQHYHQALEIKIEFNDRYSQASTYHQLGRVAEEQRQWAQAKQHYHQALEIKIEFNDRYGQASTYYQLGRMAQAQLQWAQAEQNLLQALEIYIEFNDSYEQARTYHQLGSLAQTQRKWAQAEQHYRQAFGIFKESNDADSARIVIRSLARLQQACGDTVIIARTAELLGFSIWEVEQLFQEIWEQHNESSPSNEEE